MANTVHRKKTARQNEDRRIANRSMRSTMRTSIRRVLEACAESNQELAKERLAEAMKRIDKCARNNIIHQNNAARQKSSLAKRVGALA